MVQGSGHVSVDKVLDLCATDSTSSCPVLHGNSLLNVC